MSWGEGIYLNINRDDVEHMQETMIFASGMLLGSSDSDDDPYARTARLLAWQACALAIALGRKPTLIWKYDRAEVPEPEPEDDPDEETESRANAAHRRRSVVTFHAEV